MKSALLCVLLSGFYAPNTSNARSRIMLPPCHGCRHERFGCVHLHRAGRERIGPQNLSVREEFAASLTWAFSLAAPMAGTPLVLQWAGASSATPTGNGCYRAGTQA